MESSARLLICFLGICGVASGAESWWPQFRGPNASGLAAADANPPIEFGPAKNLLWKTPVAPGHSSPCIWRDHIFLAAFDPDKKQLLLICLNRKDGTVRWQRDLPADRIEKVHSLGGQASATPATDGERVYAYFGSAGLFCHDFDGNELWKVAIKPPQTTFGSGTSPIVVGELVILNRDERKDCFVLALDRKTGKEVWKRASPLANSYEGTSYSTPVVWNDAIVLHRSGEVVGLRQSDGSRLWSVSAASSGTSTPALGADHVFVGAWSNLGEPDLRVDLPGFADLLKAHDKDNDQRISEQEFPNDLLVSRRPEAGDIPGAQFSLKPFFGRLDANKDGHLGSFEWTAAKLMMAAISKDHGLLAIRAGGAGDVTGSHIAWQEKKSIPEVPSPLCVGDHVYMVKDGGIVTKLDAKTGKIIYRSRLGASGAYFGSPVSAGGRIYVGSVAGIVAVFSIDNPLKVLAKNDLKEPIHATPAIVGNALYIRTAGNLYAFSPDAK